MDAVAPPRYLGCAGCPTWPAASTTSPPPTSCGRPRYDDHAIDAIAAAAGGGPRLLDVGAGTGRLSGPLLEKGFDVVAVEPLDAMRAILARPHRRRPRAGRPRRGAAAPRRERRRRRLQRRLALVRRRPRRRRAGARRQARRRRGGVRHAPALVRQRRRARLVAGSAWSSTRRCPRATIRYLTGSRRPDGLEGHPAFEEIADARRALRAPHRPRRDRRALGIDVVRRDAARAVSAPTFLAELDGMLARRGVDEVDIPYRAELWITRRRPAPAPPADPSGSGELTSIGAPVTGCAKASRAACRNWRSSPRRPGVPYSGSPTTG